MQNETKAGAVATATSLQNHSITGGYQKDFQFENIIDTVKLQSDLTAHLARHRRVRRLVRCFGCGDAKSLLKMSSLPGVCRKCVSGLKGKGKTARSHFIERVKSNVGRFLRTAVAL